MAGRLLRYGCAVQPRGLQSTFVPAGLLIGLTDELEPPTRFTEFHPSADRAGGMVFIAYAGMDAESARHASTKRFCPGRSSPGARRARRLLQLTTGGTAQPRQARER